MAGITMPRAVHEALGETQTPVELGLIGVVGLGLAGVIAAVGSETLAAIEWWRAAIAILLLIDICCGCVANFTFGTDRYYAARPRNRWVFIAVHWHLVVMALAIGAGGWYALGVTAFTLAGASAVNVLHGSRLQPAVGGALLAVGVTGVVIAATTEAVPLLLVTASGLFVVKVLYGFAVTHFRPRSDG